MPVTSSSFLSTDSLPPQDAAERIMEKLAATYPHLRSAIFDSPRLAGALEAIARTTNLEHDHIFEALTAREMATAQRPIGVLISRCTELLESPPALVSTRDPAFVQEHCVDNAESPSLAVVHDLAESRRVSPTEETSPVESIPEPVVDVSPGHAPAQRPDFVPGLIRAEHRPKPTRGLRKVICRSSFGLINPGPGKRELAEVEITKRIAAPFRGSRNIVMLSIKGGVGKTTVSLGLGHTFATHRNDRIVAIDASPDPGTLGQRVAGRGGSIRDLVGMESVASYADIQALSTQQSTGLEIISSDRLFQGNERVTSDDYRNAVGCLSTYFNLVMTDCGAGVPTASLHSLLEVADQVVIVTAPMVDAGWSTGLLLDCLDDGGLGPLVANAAVVVNHLQQLVQVDEDEFDSYFANRCRAVVHLPWDENLASGGSMQLDRMSVATRDAYRRLAATVADGLAAAAV
jgi:MinD-like ATPase involved in chromosome partitioning or flagellar assembly